WIFGGDEERKILGEPAEHLDELLHRGKGKDNAHVLHGLGLSGPGRSRRRGSLGRWSIIFRLHRFHGGRIYHLYTRAATAESAYRPTPTKNRQLGPFRPPCHL